MKRMILAITACAILTSCSKSGGNHIAPQALSASTSGSTNGVAGSMNAYYDSTLFTINFMQLSDAAAAALLVHNKSANNIYEVEGTGETQLFVPVLDAIQKDGFNPIWREQLITFNTGFTPHQFYSDNQVLAAAAGGEITLTATNEMYRCAVIGHK